jgi:hypothetical protein
LSKAINKVAVLLLLVAGFAGAIQAQTAEELHITRRSSFETPGGLRDPLAPIGWQKAGDVIVDGNGPVVRTVESYIVPAAFVISSISLDRIPLAIINGKPYGEGDMMPFNAGGEKIQLQVGAIRDGAVTLLYKAHQVICPIRTAKLKPVSPER